jgi:flavin reductase (DIM6/NTAB) family NADH-FMN oxidoreductase RutF
MIKSFDPKELTVARVHEILLGTVAPRPIAWASTVDKYGKVNLAPFSFFNVFGSNPPILVFSPNKRVRDNTTKHTLSNIESTRECVINIASYSLSERMVITSTEYAHDVDEFVKAGLTPEPSVKVRPPRVKEATAQYECIVRDIIYTGEGGGAANLIICEVVQIHVQDHIFNEQDRIDPVKVDNIARLGASWYTRAKEGLYAMTNPTGTTNIGYDGLPAHVLESRYLTAADISLLARMERKPELHEIEMVKTSTGISEIQERYHNDKDMIRSKFHNLAKELLHEGKTEEALRVLYAFEG